MAVSSEPKDLIFTAIDIELSVAYYPILLEWAQARRELTYGELVAEAQRRYPGNPVVQRAIPRSTGRRLEVIGAFCRGCNLPDLTALVLNSQSGEVGPGFDPRADPQAIREAIFARNWHALAPEFDGYLTQRRRALIPRKRVSKDTALRLMSEHYTAHKQSLPQDIKQHRPLILELLEEGFSPEEAFEQALNE